MKKRILTATMLLAGWPVGLCEDLPAPSIHTFPGIPLTGMVEWQDDRSGLYANYLQVSPDLVHWSCVGQVASMPGFPSYTGFQSDARALFYRIYSVDIASGNFDPTDSDGDGIPDSVENTHTKELPSGTNPYNADSDHDGIPDGEDDDPMYPNFVQMYSSDTLTVWTPRG